MPIPVEYPHHAAKQAHTAEKPIENPYVLSTTTSGKKKLGQCSGLKARCVNNKPLGVLCLLLALNACAPLPPLKHTDTPQAEHTLGSPWWTQFHSEQLNALVLTALKNNHNLLAAQARIRAAQASLEAAYGKTFPTLTANGNVSSQFISASLNASYEVDMWAKVRQAEQSAHFQFQATQFEHDTTQISVAGQVTLAWLQWIAANQTIALLQTEQQNHQTNLQLIELRFRQGIAQASDVLQQRQLLESAQGNLSTAQANRDVALTALATLLGQAPNTLALQEEALPQINTAPSPSVPTDLLERRPDLQQAKALLHAADSNLAAAIAAQFPQLTLSASWSDQARNTNLLFDNWVRNLSINLVAPLLDGSARAAEVQRQRALLDQALAQYQQAALNALADVHNALTQEHRQAELVRSLEMQLQLAQTSLNRLFAEYRNGSESYIAILNAQQSVSALQRNVIVAKHLLLNFRVALYKAISGDLK